MIIGPVEAKMHFTIHLGMLRRAFLSDKAEGE